MAMAMAMGDEMQEKKMKSHAVFLPFPAQSHIKCMLKLAKLLHSKGVHITFVNTEYNHNRFLRSGGPRSLDGFPGFTFETISDGLPRSDADATQDMPALCQTIRDNNCLAPFVELLGKLNSGSGDDVPPVSCVVADGFMGFAIDAGEEVGVPVVMFWTLAGCGFMGFYQCHRLVEKGLTPLKDESYLTNGYLDTILDFIPGMKGIRMRDLPSYVRTMDVNEMLFKFCTEAPLRTAEASGVILHTFDSLEQDLVTALSSMFPNFYTIGPLQLLLNKLPKEAQLCPIRYSLWKEEPSCLEWLDSKEPESVVYVNFGSIAVMSLQQMVEFGWGLSNSNHYFLWIIRPDLVVGDSAMLPPEFMEVTRERGFIASWINQEQVLNHPSVGGFLTHGGWGSTIESLSAGVPIICWPFFGDQPTHCRYMCTEWEVGMEIDSDAKRGEVEKLIKELMEGAKGKRMKNKSVEWKKLAEEATSPKGSSSLNLEKFVNQFMRN